MLLAKYITVECNFENIECGGNSHDNCKETNCIVQKQNKYFNMVFTVLV
jgi:hypothetical protein